MIVTKTPIFYDATNLDGKSPVWKARLKASVFGGKDRLF